jgi:hypothetical protein
MSDDVNIDLDAIARHLVAERRGSVRGRSGYFGAEQMAAEVRDRFQAPKGGGRATDPVWTERRLVPLSRPTLDRLQHLCGRMHVHGVTISPLQMAALLLEHAIELVEEGEELTESADAGTADPSEAAIAREALRLLERSPAPASIHIHEVNAPDGAVLPTSAVGRLRRILSELAGNEG